MITRLLDKFRASLRVTEATPLACFVGREGDGDSIIITRITADGDLTPPDHPLTDEQWQSFIDTLDAALATRSIFKRD